MPIVKTTLDPNNPPKLSDAAKASYDAMTDDDIDYTAAPDMGDVDWTTLKIAPPIPKGTVTMRLEEDIIGFFKGDDPKGFTARMASVLTAYARAHQAK